MPVHIAVRIPKRAMMGMILRLARLKTHRPVARDWQSGRADQRIQKRPGNIFVNIIGEKASVHFNAQLPLFRENSNAAPIGIRLSARQRKNRPKKDDGQQRNPFSAEHATSLKTKTKLANKKPRRCVCLVVLLPLSSENLQLQTDLAQGVDNLVADVENDDRQQKQKETDHYLEILIAALTYKILPATLPAAN